jgi:hypothetical protein
MGPGILGLVVMTAVFCMAAYEIVKILQAKAGTRKNRIPA